VSEEPLIRYAGDDPAVVTLACAECGTRFAQDATAGSLKLHFDDLHNGRIPDLRLVVPCAKCDTPMDLFASTEESMFFQCEVCRTALELVRHPRGGQQA
jgi:hypothetical protein